MKAKILYNLGFNHNFYVQDAEIARSGKWIDLGTWKPRINSFDWGNPTPEMLAEAKAIDDELKKLSVRRRALINKLKATQPELLAAASKVPETPKAKPEPPPLLTDDMI